MWQYEKKLQYPVKIKNPNPALAKLIITAYGGPDGEAGAAMRYLSQRYTMPYKEVIGILTDVGTEELAHQEIVSAIVYQLTRDLTPEQIKEAGFDAYFVDHTTGIYPVAASGVPFSASAFQSKGDAITDIMEDLAAEQKARTTYDNIIRFTDDPDVLDPIRFLRQREITHFQRFGDPRMTRGNVFIFRARRNNKDFSVFRLTYNVFDSIIDAKGGRKIYEKELSHNRHVYRRDLLRYPLVQLDA